jgi:Putative DNA-binding domain
LLPFPLHQITESFLSQICSEQWPETQTLEFKSILPLNAEENRQEFRKDVCALANADGGDLVFGISERDGRAKDIHAITGNEVDAAKRRLRQILESKVEPRIHGIQIHACPVGSDGFVLVLRVPSSFDGPHRFGPIAEHRFAIRNDTATTDMTYDQLRSAFGRGATLLEKTAQFRERRVDQIEGGKSPKRLTQGSTLVAHLIPLNGLAGRTDVDVEGLIFDHATLRIDPNSVWKRTANLDGLLMYPYDDANGIDAYVQLFRNGSFEIVKNVHYDPRPGNGPARLLGAEVAAQVRLGLLAYNTAAPKLNAQGPCVLAVSIINALGTTITLGPHHATSTPSIETRLDLPEVMLDDISGALDLDAITKPTMDVLYQCYGQARCPNFDNTGKWIEPR